MDSYCTSIILKREDETEFSSELLGMFTPHSKFVNKGHKKTNCLDGWDTCENLHDEDSPFQCANNHPYLALQLVQMSLSDGDETSLPSRTGCTNEEIKRRSRIPNTLNLTIRRSKSTRCVQNGQQACAFMRGFGNHPSLRYDSKFPTLFQGIREIQYEFKPIVDHQEHADAYRNSYTNILIRNFRELHQVTSPAGERGQRGARMSMSAGSTSIKSKSEPGISPQSSPNRKGASSPSPVIYSDQCQTGPIVILSGTNISSKQHGFSPSTSACLFPKSTMEVNTVGSRSSPHRPFGEQSTKAEHSKSVKNNAKQQSGDLLFLKRKNYNGRMEVVSRSSTKGRNCPSPTATQRTSPFGKVPVRVRRSSPSIRGRRDPSAGFQGGNRFLSIAVATHTVASPYRSSASHSEEELSLRGNMR